MDRNFLEAEERFLSPDRSGTSAAAYQAYLALKQSEKPRKEREQVADKKKKQRTR